MAEVDHGFPHLATVLRHKLQHPELMAYLITITRVSQDPSWFPELMAY